MNTNGILGFKGERGDSAYEIAVKNGYEGTEQEWIDHFGLDLSDYIKDTDIIDDLTHEYTTKPLSAKQGKTLKDSLDTTNANVTALQNQIAVVSGIAEISTGETNIAVDYPEGFGYSNCIVIGGRWGTQPVPGLSLDNTGDIVIQSNVVLGDPKIIVYVYASPSIGETEFDFKLVLLKINNLMDSEE